MIFVEILDSYMAPLWDKDLVRRASRSFAALRMTGRTVSRFSHTKSSLQMSTSPSCHLPYLHCHIATTRGYDLAVGGPVGGPDGAGVVAIDDKLAPVCNVPDLHGFVGAAGDDLFAVMGPIDGPYLTGMVTIGEEEDACGGIPDLHCAINSRRGDA